MSEQYLDPVPGYDGAEEIEVAPVGDEDDPVTDPGTDPEDRYVEGVDDEAGA
ncbi:hypothetical protein [Nocardiopsis composta]|uniref:Uncharacterized protein n=1 Tax=Nocardiopsis composta TaxID=157465 RepID=A0A7W8QKW0_9ACTN|nr:hypothetical protein [Nocardiopsis composta]MBB5431361.1 hypothetical protein [Nocardiopsis composta]